MQALAWNSIWHEDLIDMDEKSFFWVGSEIDKSYGYREKRDSQTTKKLAAQGFRRIHATRRPKLVDGHLTLEAHRIGITCKLRFR